ncbi:type II toxin-antitoxin system RnlA family toxin [Desulfobacula sp.]|uniref:type II toxin-antitoxin system RnlA family toxin n=1 Tax=Desulfobacula sp. TaxID=2593537 RepID=UPI0025B99D75|nr:type II toxin-antitoxin system RnlA family toxin [Desulfobacula sp.]MBC2705955.1 type II toxin-antitoxin system RnlA family toxin [Desulfobacula sp.]
MPNSFKNLNINRETYDKLIKEHELCSLDHPVEIQKKGNGLHHKITKKGKSARFIAFFKKNGSTTFQIIDPVDNIAKDFLEEICEKCIVNKTNSGHISCPDFSQDKFELLIEFLQEENEINEIQNNENEIHYKATSKYKDSITLKRYPTTNSFLIQGRPLYLYSEAKSLLAGLIDFDKVVEIESNLYKIDIKPNDIQLEIEGRLAPVIDFLDEKIIKIIAPSFVLMKIEIQLDDYSSFVFPALRGIEGYIRKLLSEYSKDHKNTKQIGSLFDANSFEPLDFLKKDIANDNVCLALKDAYSIYYKHRHTLVHTQSFAETTRIIEKKQTAEALLNEIFDVICSSFLRI